MRILIVEDSFLERNGIKELLKKYGECESAPNGQIGFEMYKVAQNDEEKIQLITVDINMPEMSGFELIENIRKHEESLNLRYDQRIKILMITISDNFKDVSASYRRGCEYYCLKPVNAENLARALKEVGLIV